VVEEREMATNRESKSSSRSAGTSGTGDKPNGSTTNAGNGAADSSAAGAGATSQSTAGTDNMGSSTGTGSTSTRSTSTGGNSKANGAEGAGILGGIQQKVTSRVDEQKNRAADGLGGIADVIRNAGNELRTENEALASYVDMASDQMRRFADQIRQKGVADMMDDVNSFARRRPALFIGGAFLVGMGIARFLKSSSQDYDDRSYDEFSNVDPMTAGPGSPSYSGDLGEAGSF
jgi:hypothetical protein